MGRITYKKPAEIEKMRAAGRVVSTVLAALREAVRPGVSSGELDSLAHELITRHGGTSSFLNHRAGPHVYHWNTCISVNDEVVHGIPRADRMLRDGDIVSLDVGVRLKGYHADSAITVPVGSISAEAQRLLDVTRESLWLGIRAVRPRGRLREIGKAVQEYVESHGFTIVRELAGHGIGTRLWEEPQIFNYVDDELPDVPLSEGMTLAIEPMVNAGKPAIAALPDGWTIVTQDHSLSAHFEHTVAVTRGGYDILTLGPHDPGR